MSEVARLYRYKSLLSSRRSVSADSLMQRLEISRATLKRDIAKLRDQFRMPIVFDRDRGGYRIDAEAEQSELPGLWFSDDEILALVTIQQLLAQLQPGLLGPRLRPLQERLASLMETHGLPRDDLAQRVRIVHAGKRKLTTQAFEAVAAATLGRRRLSVTHFNRQSGQTLAREISPQRLVHYRDNWYVDAWCHLRDDLRSFAVDALEQVRILDAEAQEVDGDSIDARMASSYGIFGGQPRAWATLRFSPQRARWVAGEVWHPQQQSRTDPDGSYLLAVPYSDDRELLGDILRFGADVQVLKPMELRAKVRQALVAALGEYE